jgi:hypothetical protein
MVRRMRGGSLRSILGGVNKFLRRTKLVSRVGSALGAVGVPYAGSVGSVAGSLGYGRRRRGGRRRVGRPRKRRR